jgi:hypothetical protein
VPPPSLDAEAWDAQCHDPRYATLPPDAEPRGESLADVCARLLPYWYDAIVPDLRAGGCVFVVSHGNTLRALVKHLESIPDEQIAGLDIPHRHPAALPARAGPAPGCPGRPVPRPARGPGRDRGRQEPGPRRGTAGLSEALLGSVGQYCVHHAPCPVVIMRGKY